MPRKDNQKATKTKRSASAPKKRATKRPLLFTPKRLCAAACIATLLICLPIAGSFIPDLSGRGEYQFGPDDVTVTSIPAWVPEDIVTQVFERSGLGPAESLLDEQVTEKIAAAFYTHPWVATVHSVKKRFPTQVTVDVTFRVPAALISGVDGYYPVDGEGVLLPPRDFSGDAVSRYPIVEHIASVPFGALGEQWGDPAVTGAAALAALLQQEQSDGRSWWEHLELEAIVAPSRVTIDEESDELEFALKTTGGSLIQWGRGPNTQHPGELTVAQKLERLQEYRTDYGGFDDAHGPYEIDIRPWHGIGRSRLAQRPATRL